MTSIVLLTIFKNSASYFPRVAWRARLNKYDKAYDS